MPDFFDPFIAQPEHAALRNTAGQQVMQTGNTYWRSRTKTAANKHRIATTYACPQTGDLHGRVLVDNAMLRPTQDSCGNMLLFADTCGTLTNGQYVWPKALRITYPAAFTFSEVYGRDDDLIFNASLSWGYGFTTDGSVPASCALLGQLDTSNIMVMASNGTYGWMTGRPFAPYVTVSFYPTVVGTLIRFDYACQMSWFRPVSINGVDQLFTWLRHNATASLFWRTSITAPDQRPNMEIPIPPSIPFRLETLGSYHESGGSPIGVEVSNGKCEGDDWPDDPSYITNRFPQYHVDITNTNATIYPSISCLISVNTVRGKV